jgi:hypothetical protein
MNSDAEAQADRTAVTINDPRRVELSLRVDMTGLPVSLLRYYRNLRMTGFGRRDANLIVMGDAAVVMGEEVRTRFPRRILVVDHRRVMNRTAEAQLDSGFADELERLVLADLTAFYAADPAAID